MSETNAEVTPIWENKVFITAVAVIILVVVFMYFHDQKQQRDYELQRLERRVELLEEWGRPRQNTGGRQGQRW